MTPAEWLLSGDTGTSSKVICAVMTGSAIDAKPWADNTPRDAGDFGRCYRLLNHFPEWRGRMQEVADKFPCWTGLVREWARLEEMFTALRPPDADGWREMYDLMSELRDEGRLAAGWERTGLDSWKHGDAMILSLGKGLSISTGT